MKQITRWRPDTCKCVIDFRWDDQMKERERIHSLDKVIEKCETHIHLSDVELFSELFEENQNKNKVVSKIIEVFDFNSGEVMEKGLIEFSFDEQRKLKIEVKGINEEQRIQITNILLADKDIDSKRIKEVLRK